MATAKQNFLELVGELEPAIELAFLNAVRNTATDIPFGKVVKAFERGDIEAAISLMDLEPASLSALYSSIQSAYSTAGASAAKQASFQIKFDLGDPNIDNYLRNEAGTRIKKIAEDNRNAIRNVLAESFGKGENPTSAVSEIAGSINRATGRREGGLIGLSDPQIEWVKNARDDLETLDSRYLTRAARDKRYDRLVKRHIAQKKPIPKAKIKEITERYSDKLLAERAKTIALDETMSAINNTKVETFIQGAKKQRIDLGWVDKTWRSAGDSRVRHTHNVLNGKTVRFNESFYSPSGNYLAYPHDPKAPMKEKARCRCWLEIRVNHKRRYGIGE